MTAQPGLETVGLVAHALSVGVRQSAHPVLSASSVTRAQTVLQFAAVDRLSSLRPAADDEQPHSAPFRRDRAGLDEDSVF